MSRLKLVHGATPDRLPPTWDAADGRAIRWEPWQTLQVFVCTVGERSPNDAYECDRCGSSRQQETCVGAILPRRGEMFEITEDVASKRVKDSSYTRTRRVPAWPVIRLVAFRCPDCGRIDIYDEEAGRHA